MVTKWVDIRSILTAAQARGVWVALYVFTGLISARAQQGTGTPVVPPVAASKGMSIATSSPDTRMAPLNGYIVSPEDLLDVYVMDVPEVTRSYRVSSNGLLTLPLLAEPIPAAGESLEQLSRLIATRFHDAGMLNDAHVTVSLIETRLNTVMVTGEVRNPQSCAVLGPLRLLDVLVKAGGLTNDAGDDAIITRGEIGARADLEESARSDKGSPSAKGQTFTLNIRKLVEKGDDKSNILLYPGDRVTVQRAELIYIMGAVTRPGGYVLNESRQQITVLKALAMAGDVSGLAKKSHIMLLRRNPTGPPDKREEIPVDYRAMVKGQIADMRLQPDDILYVPESGGLKALRTTANAAVQVATMAGTSLMIYH